MKKITIIALALVLSSVLVAGAIKIGEEYELKSGKKLDKEELKEAKYYGLHVCLTDNSVAYCESVEQNNQYCNFIMNYEQHQFYCKNSFVPIETYTSMHGITEADVLNAFYMDVTHQPTMSNQPKTDKNAMKYKGSKR